MNAGWWVIALAAIGVAALAGAVVRLFFALGRRPKALAATEPPRLDEPDAFLLALGGAVNAPTRTGGRIELLNDGDEFFPAMLDAIHGARHSVTFFTYIFETGEIGARILDALTERARAGVAVRLLLDGFGGMGADPDRLEALQSAGGRVQRYRPLHFGKLTRFHKRNHRRAIVVDGRIGFTGGASIGDKWRGHAQSPEHWRDMMFRVSGPLAASLQAAFGEAWSNTHGEILAGPRFFPLDAAPVEVVGADPENGERAAGGEKPDRDGVDRHVHVISSPSNEAHPLRKLFWLSFAAANERLFITSSYFVPDLHIRAVLIDRARAGVDVRVLLPNHHTDARPVRWAAHHYYDELLAAGVRIWEFQPTFMHAKAVVADGVWSVIGSANLDIRSKELNEENVLGVLDADLAARLERTFHDDLARSREIRLDGWRRRGLAARLRERASVLFAEQF